MKRPSPIIVRPRKDSDLEFVWAATDRNMAKMREILHLWAEKAKGEGK